MKKLDNYINGVFVPPVSGQYLDNFNPATGEVYSFVADSGAQDVEAAIESAYAAFHSWKNTSAENKFKVLNRIAELLDKRNEEFAIAESRDQGKPIWLARAEITRAAQNFRFFATGAMQFSSESHAMEDRAINYTLRQPLGVVACISPWNLPLYLFSWKIAPALATGNCVIAKPSEFTSYTAYMLAELCIEADLPAGVLNIVFGLGTNAGQAMISHPEIKAVSFTGGTATGKHISSVAGPMFKKLSLELGGKNPNIIFADADLDKAIKTTINSSFQNQGEICLCGSRVFIQREVYESCKSKIIAAVSQLTVGNPQLEETRIGAIVSKPHYEKVLKHLQIAREEGGAFLTGGEPLFPVGFENGWYIAPTVIENLDMKCRTNQEEIYGPVITLMPFDTEEEVLEAANDTPYGLAATIWTSDLKRAHQMAAALESGIVWVNCWLLRDLRTPFGGVKQSGVGSEGGWEAMRFFTEPKNVCISLK